LATLKVLGLNLNIRKVYADGRVAYRHYNKRGQGAVCFAETEHKLKGELTQEMYARLEEIRKGEAAAGPEPDVSPTLGALFDEWRASADYRRDVTSKNTRRLHEDNIEKWRLGEYITEKGLTKRFGEMPYVLVEQDRMRDKLLAFRDKHSVGWRPVRITEAEEHKARKGSQFPERPDIGAYWIKKANGKLYGFQFRETPKAADHLASVLSACLSWAKARGKIRSNPMEGVKRLYRNNRAAIIWSADDMLRLKAGAATEPAKPLGRHIWDVVCLAALTGLAQTDLLRMTWSMVLDQVIDLAGGRQKTQVDAMPPILPPTRMLLERLRREQGGDPKGDQVVLLSSWGRPWTPDGFRSSMQHAKERAGIGRELHFHDLRGTAATMFAVAGYSDLQIDLFMGWTEGESAHIRRKYVNARNVAKGLQALLEGETKPALSAVSEALAEG
jgi:hypothetical protein